MKTQASILTFVSVFCFCNPCKGNDTSSATEIRITPDTAAYQIGLPDVVGEVDATEIVRIGEGAGLSRGRDLQPVPGWPMQFEVNSSFHPIQGPTLADVDGDGDLEFLIGSSENLHIWHHDGTPLDGWPQTPEWKFPRAVSVADIDGDGDMEVVAGSESFNSASGHIHVWHHDGTLAEGWPQALGGGAWGSSVEDLDGDGDYEIVTSARMYPVGRAYVFNHDGTIADGWPQDLIDVPSANPSIGDVDGDGDREIFIESYTHMYAWHHDGTSLAGWPLDISPQTFSYSTPSLADFDEDGDLEIVAGSHMAYGSPKKHYLFMWHHDGTNVSGWPRTAESWIYSSPAIGDLDGNGTLDIAVGCNSIYAYAFASDGTSLPGWPVEHPMGSGFYGSPAMADIDGDLDMEVLLGDNAAMGPGSLLHAYHHDGTTVEGWPVNIDGPTMRNCPAFGDVEGDGDLDLAAVTTDRFVYLWDLEAPHGEDRIEWRMFQNGPRHTGLYGVPVTPPCFIGMVTKR